MEVFEPMADRVHLVIIQPTPFCNLDCNYCYLPDRLLSRRMSTESLRAIYQLLLCDSELVKDSITICWHAGEPLAVPINFYEKTLQLQNEYNCRSVRVKNAIQTNGTLLNQDWCDFIKANGFSVGVSLDGPQWLHDARRTDRHGAGTFIKVLRGIELLQKNNIPFHVLSVLTDSSLNRPDEIWEFFGNLGITNIAFNVEEIEGINRVSSLQQGNSQDKYFAFFRRLLELREQQIPPRTFIRELDYMIDVIKNGSGPVRGTENIPFCILNFGWDGAISTFSPELLSMTDLTYRNFVFGQAGVDSFSDVEKNATFRRVHAAIKSGVEKCKSSCEYFGVCGGGSPSNKLYENGSFDSTETLSCRLRIKTLAEVVLTALERKHGICHADRIDTYASSAMSQPIR
jgi:uncharacterized protein